MKWILFLSLLLSTAANAAVKIPSFTQLQEAAFSKAASYEARWKALMLLTEHYPDGAEVQLQLAAEEPEWFMKNAALLGLEKMNSKKLPQIAKKLVSDPALVVRSMSVKILTAQSDAETRKLLWTELDKPYNFKKKKSLWIRHQILEHLAKNPQKNERSKFINSFEDADQKIKEFSQAGLRRIQSVQF